MIQIKTHDPNYFFLKIDNDLLGDYNKGFSLGEIFKLKGRPIDTSADELLINTKLDKLKSNINEYMQGKSNIKVGEFTKSRGVDLNGTYKAIPYRIFDNRFIYNSKLVSGLRQNLTKHEFIEDNYYLNFKPSVADVCNFSHILITKQTSEAHLFAGKLTSYSAPLYIINKQNKGQI